MMGPARDAVVHHWAPLLFMQLAAVALVVTYHYSQGLRDALVAVENVKVRGGIPFAFAVGATAGGLVPEIAKLATGRLGKPNRLMLTQALYNALVYGLVGITVMLFYQGQTIWFGSRTDVQTLAIKTAVDMFVFSPIVTIPLAVALYAWRTANFAWPEWSFQRFTSFYRDKIVPSMILAWIFWIPVLLCVYSLPANLQFPFSNLAEAAWSMVFVFFNTDGGS